MIKKRFLELELLKCRYFIYLAFASARLRLQPHSRLWDGADDEGETVFCWLQHWAGTETGQRDHRPGGVLHGNTLTADENEAKNKLHQVPNTYMDRLHDRPWRTMNKTLVYCFHLKVLRRNKLTIIGLLHLIFHLPMYLPTGGRRELLLVLMHVTMKLK